MHVSRTLIVTPVALAVWAFLATDSSLAVNLPSPAVLALCSDCECSLRVNGTVSVTVYGAPIHVNSNAECAVCTSGSSLIVEAPSLEVHADGGVCSNGNPTLPPIVESNPIPHPLACLAPPIWDLAHDLGTVAVTSGEIADLQPGFYSGGIYTNGGICMLAAGTYILDGVGLDIKGPSIFLAEGVTFYLTGTGVVDIAGTGVTRITPPESGPFEGVSIFQARPPGGDYDESGQCGDSRIIGTSHLDLSGLLYFPCAFLELGGTGDGFGNQVIAWTVWIHGTGELVIDSESTRFSLDVKPGSCPNPLNRNSHGILPVAVVGSETLDVMDIDISTVRLSRADGVGAEIAPNEGPPGPHSTFVDVATPFACGECDCHEEAGDGILDLSMKFRTTAVVEALDLDDLNNGDLVELVVTGQMADGTEFITAGDCILIVPQGTTNANVDSDVAGTFVEASPPDLNVDGSGFANFQRTYNPGTVVTLTAPVWSGNLSFQGWVVRGVMQDAGETTVQVTVVEDVTVRAVYRYWSAPPTLGLRPAPTLRQRKPMSDRPY